MVSNKLGCKTAPLKEIVNKLTLIKDNQMNIKKYNESRLNKSNSNNKYCAISLVIFASIITYSFLFNI